MSTREIIKISNLIARTLPVHVCRLSFHISRRNGFINATRAARNVLFISNFIKIGFEGEIVDEIINEQKNKFRLEIPERNWSSSSSGLFWNFMPLLTISRGRRREEEMNTKATNEIFSSCVVPKPNRTLKV